MRRISMSRRSGSGRRVVVSLISITALLLSMQSAYSQSALATKPHDVEVMTKWLKVNAIPLKSVQAGAGFEDLQPLKKVLKDAKIVGLGEATHGTREFFQFKHRMLEFLVKEMGYTVFAIEASYPACLSINDYVVYGKGDKAKALAGQGFWTWNTQEVMDLIDWMREYNRNLPEAKRIKFLGYDMQNYGHAYDRVYPYLQRVAPEYLEKIGKGFLPARVDVMEFYKKGEEEKNQLKAKTSNLLAFVAENKERFSKASSGREYEEILQCARVMDQFAAMFGDPAWDQKKQDPSKPITTGRDYYMAKNIEYLVNSEGPGAKIVVWAYNGHISRDGYPDLNYWSMGRHLRQMYGNAYYALGFAFNQGSFQSINIEPEGQESGGLTEFTMGPAGAGTIDWYLAQTGVKNYIVDLQSSQKPPHVNVWLSAPLPMKRMAESFSRKWPESKYLRPTILKDQYDGIAFFDTTTRARPLSMQ